MKRDPLALLAADYLLSQTGARPTELSSAESNVLIGIGIMVLSVAGTAILMYRLVLHGVFDKIPRRFGPDADEGIFISYRRQDEPNFAGRLSDRLTTAFGEEKVFMDISSLDLGLDFVEAINQSLSRCYALIVIIGKRWLDVVDEHGRRRLDDPEDFVRLEIETAISRGIRVIPILVEGAKMPNASQMPKSLESLPRRHMIEMSHEKFSIEGELLVGSLRSAVKARLKEKRRLKAAEAAARRKAEAEAQREAAAGATDVSVGAEDMIK
jgi:hypothetical protein